MLASSEQVYFMGNTLDANGGGGTAQDMFDRFCVLNENRRA
jgi:hypothetical protein